MATSNNSSFLSSIKVGGWTLLSRFLGLIRDMFTTNLLGASVFHDIFVVVLKIPNVFRRFFAEGAFSQAFIPIYKSLLIKDDRSEANSFINAIAGLMILVLVIFILLALIFAPIFLLIFAPGFYFDSAYKGLAVDVLRIMFPYLALISLVAFSAGIQNSHKRFSIPAATPVIFNLILIIAAIFASRFFEIPLYSLAWGVLLAGCAQLLIQFIPLYQLDAIPRPRFDFHNSNLKRFLILILPAILAGGVAQINLVVDTIFASLLKEGSPTWLYVSDRLIQFPLGVFAIAIGTVLLPNLSDSYANSNLNQFKLKLLKGIKMVTYLSIPSAIGLFFFGEVIIDLLFKRGNFVSSDVTMAFYSLQMFAIGLPFFMGMKVMVPAFFARQNTKIPLYIALLSLILNIVFNYLFAFYLSFGHWGLALGSSLASFIAFSTLYFILFRQKIIDFNQAFMFFGFRLLLPASLLVLFLLFINHYFYSVIIELQVLNKLMSVVAIIVLSWIIYFGSAFCFGIRAKEFK